MDQKQHVGEVTRMHTISDGLKIYELSKLWKEAEYNFAFWDRVDIDWDEEYKKSLSRVLAAKDSYAYYRELRRFAALLGDGHTDVSFPDDIWQDAQYFSAFPIYLFRFGKDIAVICVSEEYKNRIPLYSVLKKIDGSDAAEFVRENCYPYIWHANEAACGRNAMNELMYGRSGSSALFTFEKDGREFDVTLTREDAARIRWYAETPGTAQTGRRIIVNGDSYNCEMTDDGIAILKFTSFADGSMPETVYGHFEELSKAKAFILDVRGNTGGNSFNGHQIAAMFIDGDFQNFNGEMQTYQPTYKAWGMFRDDLKNISPSELAERYTDEESIKDYKMSRHVYYETITESTENHAPGRLNGPIAVLMNEYTSSAGEDFVDVMKANTDAFFIGSNTAGSSGQPLCTPLESGGSFRICTVRCIAQNGEDIYNKGFSPDIRVERSLADYIEGRDPALEKALAILKEKAGL